MGHSSNNTPDVPSPSRRALHSDRIVAEQGRQPLVSRGIPGAGADAVAQRRSSQGRSSGVDSYARGAEGEREVAHVLNWLDGHGFWVLHDQPWPGRPKANIDHLVVGPTGVFVVDAKNWSGVLSVTSKGVRQNGTLRRSAHLGALEQAEAIRSLMLRTTGLPQHGVSVFPVLAFTGEAVFNSDVEGVRVVSVDQLAEFIGSSPSVLPTHDVAGLASSLEAALHLDRAEVAQQVQARRASKRGKQAKKTTGSGAVKLAFALGIIAALWLFPDAISDFFHMVGDFMSRLVTDSVSNST
ncbi:nuclease-related domain-containing protein [Timonella sp. A28]|uniref:nuclease-related domain-containing protein n=1 Tax=Timonella sp. A28 TaxID=3442640 RepID=UPI003EBEADC3